MRRAVPALAMTAAGVVMLLRFQSSPSSSGIGVPASPGAGTSPSTTTGRNVVPTTTLPGGFDQGGGFDRGGFDDDDDGDFGGGFGGGEGGVPTTTPNPDANTASGANDGTFTGAEVQTRFGPVQVQATISGGALTDVVLLEAPNDHERSVRINAEAGPILRDEALAAQSAQIDQLSGATITWAAYEQSLQAALDAAHQ